ncbi:hypothetical protein C7450_10737 [Chelatococcus asaccharovorans]|uniref:Uncharacterized protein n=1 Tax=Chelatococcus asaccharovorans TaxID=28210 RepID=A0A2V3UEB5_9HYPH|nr:hypothetical protein C7450_10737 [Chelatococcus asaccharovorans]
MNHISEYLATENALQRTRIIRAAKFPKKVEIAAYAQIRKSLQAALSKPEFDRSGLELLADRLSTKARRETGYARDEALRCERAVRAFIETVQSTALSKLQISPAPSPLRLHQSGVRLKVTMDAAVSSETGGTVNSGGIVLLYAFSADRGPVKDRLNAMTGLLFWALEGGQMEPLPRLCLAIDLAGGEVLRASSSHIRFRQHVAESCHEIAARWETIDPPDDYDGPDWR